MMHAAVFFKPVPLASSKQPAGPLQQHGQLNLAIRSFALMGVIVIFQADQCKPQHIANILWAFGTLGYKPSAHLLDTLQKQATLKLSGFNPQNLANLIWAFARCAH